MEREMDSLIDAVSAVMQALLHWTCKAFDLRDDLHSNSHLSALTEQKRLGLGSAWEIK